MPVRSENIPEQLVMYVSGNMNHQNLMSSFGAEPCIQADISTSCKKGTIKRKNITKTGVPHVLSFHEMSQVTKIAVIAIVMATTFSLFYLRNSALTLFSPIMLLVAKRRGTRNKQESPPHLQRTSLWRGRSRYGRGGYENLYQTRGQTFALYFGCPVKSKQNKNYTEVTQRIY